MAQTSGYFSHFTICLNNFNNISEVIWRIYYVMTNGCDCSLNWNLLIFFWGSFVPGSILVDDDILADKSYVFTRKCVKKNECQKWKMRAEFTATEIILSHFYSACTAVMLKKSNHVSYPHVTCRYQTTFRTAGNSLVRAYQRVVDKQTLKTELSFTLWCNDIDLVRYHFSFLLPIDTLVQKNAYLVRFFHFHL